jgi:CDP-2,3-bis-(O-geranylgeranyl)-sn-glycerol synthase
MYETLALVELAVWLGLPAWIANSTPVVFGGGRPIDGGKRFLDGRRILGKGKTVRGFVAGVFSGTLTGLIQSVLAPQLEPVMEQYVIVTPEMEMILFMTVPVAFALSIGAMIGDLTGSFVKRRVNIMSGGPAPVLDQVGFIVMALIVVSPLAHPGYTYVIVLVAITLLVHWLSNAVGYVMGYKQHPW